MGCLREGVLSIISFFDVFHGFAVGVFIPLAVLECSVNGIEGLVVPIVVSLFVVFIGGVLAFFLLGIFALPYIWGRSPCVWFRIESKWRGGRVLLGRMA